MKIGRTLQIGPRTWWIIGVVSCLSAGALIAIARDSWRSAMELCVALQVVTVAIVVLAAKRPSPTLKSAETLARIERAIDNVSMRVVNESQAIQRELNERSDYGGHLSSVD